MNLTPLFRVVFFAALAIILGLALFPSEQLPTVPQWDKGNHALAFATLSVLARLAYPQRLVTAHLGLFGFGLCIELLQALTPARTADWRDVTANTVGLLLGVCLIGVATALRRPAQN
jgi:VanZ family protein